MNEQEFAKYIDLETGLGRVRGNKTLYARMLQMFLDSKEFAAFEDAVAAGNLTAAAESIHGIKGMTGNLSLTAVFETSMALMNDLRAGNLDETLLAEYREALTETQRVVREYIAQ
ncbi:Hpt domain-containing protein [Christensenellaceae bacterium OttesenSCG-928-L17]|nr:Hpt domain-containing protein [Christensenellaceae bacterium OttesenSCG-928-L17]